MPLSHHPGRGCFVVSQNVERSKPGDQTEYQRLLVSKQPVPIDCAEWQTGLTPGHERYRIKLNGEPMTGAIAANATIGWVIVVMPKHRDHDSRRRMEQYEQDPADSLLGVGRVRLTGYVEIIADQG